jgi:ribonucleotide reductase beta subunit family protein with ferritin-like domain
MTKRPLPQSILFDATPRQLFPIQSDQVWTMYKKAQSAIWTAEEIDLMHDRVDWEKKLTPGERHFISTVLAFFAASDLIVTENLAKRFTTEIVLPEALFFLQFQAMIENIHSETYNLLIQTLIKSPDERRRLFDAIHTIPVVGRKAQWADKYIQSETPFSERLIAFICVEGIFFSGSFCAIFWLKKRGLMPGLTFSNELISRDEGLHVQFGVLMFHLLNSDERPSEERVKEIMTECVEIECEFVKWALPVSLIGMNEEQMCQYIKYCCDLLMTQLGFGKIYKVLNPFDWMDMISLEGKTNFFEKRVGEYAKAGVGGQEEKSAREEKFSLDEEF